MLNFHFSENFYCELVCLIYSFLIPFSHLTCLCLFDFLKLKLAVYCYYVTVSTIRPLDWTEFILVQLIKQLLLEISFTPSVSPN